MILVALAISDLGNLRATGQEFVELLGRLNQDRAGLSLRLVLDRNESLVRPAAEHLVRLLIET